MLWTIANHHNKDIMHLQHIANHNQLMVTKAKKQDHSRNKVTSPNQTFINLWAVIFRKCVHWWPVFALFTFDLFWVLGGLQSLQKPIFSCSQWQPTLSTLLNYSLSKHNVQTRILKLQISERSYPFRKEVFSPITYRFNFVVVKSSTSFVFKPLFPCTFYHNAFCFDHYTW